MSTIEEFENAPVGATATRPDGKRAMRTIDTCTPWATTEDTYLDHSDMVSLDYVLDSVPTSAREALDLAWGLAYLVKEGQTLPPGTDYLLKRGGRPSTMRASCDLIASAYEEKEIRTLDPLPEPEPDWLDAPAVIAVCNEVMDRAVFVRHGDNWWVSEHHASGTTGLRDVTPLYPKETDG